MTHVLLCSKRFTLEDVLKQLDMLDDENFNDNDSDRDTKCVVCNKRGLHKETRYICSTCVSKPALCVVPCFKEYHSNANY